MKIKTPLIIIISVVVLALLYFVFFKKEKDQYSTVKVQKGDVVQEVSETGTIKKGDEVDMAFKSSGRIQKVYVKVGDLVQGGQVLASQENSQLIIQKTEAEAALEVAKAQLNKLIAGVSSQEIKISQTALANASTALDTANKNLADVMTDANDDLNSAYEDALNTIEDSYIKAFNAQQTVKTVQITYFQGNDQFSLKVKDEKSKIDTQVSEVKSNRDSVNNNPAQDNIDIAMSGIKKSSDTILASLTVIRQTCEDASYQNVSSTDKTSLDTQKSYISTALTNIVNSQQTISNTKITNDTNINTAQGKVTAAQGSLAAAQDNLDQLKAPPRPEDVDLYNAKVKQAEAQVSLLKNQIYDTNLVAPTAGQVAAIDKLAGETVQSNATVISLIPANPLQVEADIYEEDIVRVKVGNPVDIRLTAFPEKILKGKVISIDPAEKLINGVAYYKVLVDFNELIENVKPGMTADVAIITDSKRDVLTIPEAAIEKEDGKYFVQVLENKDIKKRQIEIGMIGTDSQTEVISGLTEEEEVVMK